MLQEAVGVGVGTATGLMGSPKGLAHAIGSKASKTMRVNRADIFTGILSIITKNTKTGISHATRNSYFFGSSRGKEPVLRAKLLEFFRF